MWWVGFANYFGLSMVLGFAVRVILYGLLFVIFDLALWVVMVVYRWC